MDRETIVKGIQECDLNGGLIGNCPYKGILTLLKEQEAVEPMTDNEGGYWCKSCYEDIVWHQKYCSNCGKKVKWDG